LREKIKGAGYQIWTDDQRLYLIYDAGSQLMPIQEESEKADSAISGLIHVSLPDAGIENLVSTRRIPPQSPLDGKPLGFPLNLWSSSTGLMLAVLGNSPCFQVFGTSAGTNAWAPVISDTVQGDVKIGDGGALIGKGFVDHGFAQLVLMNGTDSQVLLSNPNRTPTGGNPSARWNLPDDFRSMAPNALCRCSAVMRGNDLCVYSVRRGDTGETFDACLYYFAQGEKNGVKIPLEFAFADSNGPNSQRLAGAQSVIHDFQSLQATNYGLIVVQEFMIGGFCVVPWSDIDACRAHASLANSSAIVPPAPVTAPTESTATPTPNPTPPPKVPPTSTATPMPSPTPQAAAPPTSTATPMPGPTPSSTSQPVSSHSEVD
jgi:hypothetical protein